MTVCAPSNIACLIREGLGYIESPAAIVFGAMLIAILVATLYVRKG